MATVQNAVTFDDTLHDSTFNFSSYLVAFCRYICCFGIQTWKFLSPSTFNFSSCLVAFCRYICCFGIQTWKFLSTLTFSFSTCMVPYYRYICCIGIQFWKYLSPKKFGIPWFILMFDNKISLKDVSRCRRNLFVFGKCILSPEY